MASPGFECWLGFGSFSVGYLGCVVLLGRGRFEQGRFWGSWEVSAQSQGQRRLRGGGGRVQGEGEPTCSWVATRARARVLMVVVHVCLVCGA